ARRRRTSAAAHRKRCARAYRVEEHQTRYGCRRAWPDLRGDSVLAALSDKSRFSPGDAAMATTKSKIRAACGRMPLANRRHRGSVSSLRVTGSWAGGQITQVVIASCVDRYTFTTPVWRYVTSNVAARHFVERIRRSSAKWRHFPS